jgi:uncharacterized protein with HEPN domain
MDSLAPSVAARVQGIQGSITLARKLMNGRSVDDLRADAVKKAAFERSMQIISDASRGLPEDWRAGRPDIPWQALAELGDVISRDYDRLDLVYLWRTAETVLGPIEEVLAAAVADSERRNFAR